MRCILPIRIRPVHEKVAVIDPKRLMYRYHRNFLLYRQEGSPADLPVL